MKINFTALIFLVVIQTPVVAQKFILDKSLISFFSDGAIEDISAQNKKTSSIFNSTTTDIVFSVPITEFQFEKSLMQEHFNEKYMESDKFPKAVFQGKIVGFDPAASTKQDVKALGKMTIHGVTKDIEIPGIAEKNGDRIVLKSKFIVKLEDYKITIPQLLWQNIAEQVEVTVDLVFKAQ
jgi:hypothetical protein